MTSTQTSTARHAADKELARIERGLRRRMTVTCSAVTVRTKTGNKTIGWKWEADDGDWLDRHLSIAMTNIPGCYHAIARLAQQEGAEYRGTRIFLPLTQPITLDPHTMMPVNALTALAQALWYIKTTLDHMTPEQIQEEA